MAPPKRVYDGSVATTSTATDCGAKRSTRGRSAVLAIGWLSTLVVFGTALLALSIGGNGDLIVLPFIGCATIATIQRVRNRLTRLGTVCAGLCALPISLSIVAAILEAHFGHGYLLFLGLTATAGVTVTLDLADRFR